MKLSKLPKHMQTVRWIKNAIEHEDDGGLHTYRMCECGRMSCRSFMCIKCWKDVLREAWVRENGDCS